MLFNPNQIESLSMYTLENRWKTLYYVQHNLLSGKFFLLNSFKFDIILKCSDTQNNSIRYALVDIIDNNNCVSLNNTPLALKFNFFKFY